MANNNKAAIVEYSTGGERLKLSPSIVRNYLVSGDARNVTDQEVMMFMMLCKGQHLNPFLRDAYLIKFGNRPATIVTGKGTFLKRAAANPSYDGKESGIIVMDEDGNVTERNGCFYSAGETIIGGWAKVYHKGRRTPEYVSVPFEEYAGRKADGSLNSQWASKPATMIQKVAVVQALREAFPDDFSGLYSPEEMAEATGNVVLDEAPVDIEDVQAQPVEPTPAPADPGEALFGYGTE